MVLIAVGVAILFGFILRFADNRRKDKDAAEADDALELTGATVDSKTVGREIAKRKAAVKAGQLSEEQYVE